MFSRILCLKIGLVIKRNGFLSYQYRNKDNRTDYNYHFRELFIAKQVASLASWEGKAVNGLKPCQDIHETPLKWRTQSVPWFAKFKRTNRKLKRLLSLISNNFIDKLILL